MKTYAVGTQKKRLGKVLLMNTTTYISWRNKKNISNFWLKKKLSGAMLTWPQADTAQNIQNYKNQF